MPEMPAFLANVLEPRFARATQVLEVEDLAPRLRRVRFGGEALRGISFRPGQEIEFRVSDRAFRHYTPMRFEGARGECDVLFYLHGEGPGSAWAAALDPGSRVGVLGPGGGFGLRDAASHIFLGDETALGLFACMAAGAQGAVRGAVEVGEGCEAWPSLAGVALAPAVRTGRRGDALLAWVDAAALQDDGTTQFYLSGHTESIVRLRAELLRRGWPRRAIATRPYWAEGRRGL